MPFTKIIINNVTLTYTSKCIFKNLNLEIAQGQWIGLLGPSGIGKSSLVRMLANLINYSGSISVDNHLPLYTQIAYMAQSDLLLPWFSVLDNVLLKLKLRSVRERQQELERAHSLLKKVGLENFTHFYPKELSGGMRQRVALVRTLMEDHPIILMDEPFSALDAITRYKLQALTASLLKNKTVIFITHDPLEALRLANEIYILQGNPVTLNKVVTLKSAIPREFNDPIVIEWQSKLYQSLAIADDLS